MDKKDSIDQLIQIIHNQNAWYLAWFFGLVAVIGIFLGFYSYQQKRISDEQVEKFNNEIKKSWKINEDLKRSNESIIQYSLVSMARENYPATTDWNQRAELYLSSKRMFETYYKNNREIQKNLDMAKRATVAAAYQKFSDLLTKDRKKRISDFEDRDEVFTLVRKGFVMKKSEDPLYYEYLDRFDNDYLKTLGHKIQSEDIQAEWFTELEKVNNFWVKETL